MKIIAAIALSLGIILFGVQTYSFLRKGNEEEKNFSEAQRKLDAAKLDAANLQAELKFLSYPENVEKELKARFNYKAPGEKLIILVPTSTSASSTQ